MNDLLLAYFQEYRGYHSSKENMVWLASTTYIAAAALLIMLDKPFWRDWPACASCLFFVAVLLTAIAAFGFVHWQFKNRRFAATFSLASANVAASWIHSPPQPSDLAPTELSKGPGLQGSQKVPRVLADEFARLKEIQPGGSWAEPITYAVMGLWTIAALVRVIASFVGLPACMH